MNDNVKLSRATARTLQEWAELYEKKTDDKAILPKGFKLYYLPERGFAMYQLDVEGKIMKIYRVCGDAKFWHDVAEIIAYQQKMEILATLVTREVYAYMRFWNWNIVKEYNVNNQKRFICTDSQGRKVVLTHSGTKKDGTPTYLCTQYLYERLSDADVQAFDTATRRQG